VIFSKKQSLAEDRKIFKQRLKGKEAVAEEKPIAENLESAVGTGQSGEKQDGGGENQPS